MGEGIGNGGVSEGVSVGYGGGVGYGSHSQYGCKYGVKEWCKNGGWWQRYI